jgi:hypothetical protein
MNYALIMFLAPVKQTAACKNKPLASWQSACKPYFMVLRGLKTESKITPGSRGQAAG